MVWQFDCPERGEGMVQAFRRAQSPDESIGAKLRGLDPNAVYTLTNLDSATSKEIAGKELMELGLVVELADKPGAAVILYRRL